MELKNMDEMYRKKEEEKLTKDEKLVIAAFIMVLIFIISSILIAVFLGITYHIDRNEMTSDGVYRKEMECIPIKKNITSTMLGEYKSYDIITIAVNVSEQDLVDRKAIYSMKLVLTEKELNETFNSIKLNEPRTCWVPEKTVGYNFDSIELDYVSYITDEIIILEYDQEHTQSMRKLLIASLIIILITMPICFVSTLTCIGLCAVRNYRNIDLE